MRKITVTMLGEFKLLVDNEDISLKLRLSAKKLFLLQYLILSRGNPVTVDQLTNILWEGSSEINLTNTLKTLVSRLRKDLSAVGLDKAIVTGQGSYMWKLLDDADIDVFNLEDICTKLRPITNLNDENRLEFEKVLSIYNGDLLATSPYSSWVSPKMLHYQNLFIEISKKYIELLNSNEEYDSVIVVCGAVLEKTPYDSMINIELMSALVKLGREKEAFNHYSALAKLHYDQLGVHPSDELVAFYKKIIKMDRDHELKIEGICKELRDYSEESGAFVCEYPVFKEIYSMHMRNLKRLGSTMYLAMISIKNTVDEDQTPADVNIAMHRLLEFLQINLRSGDTITRYSPSQYAALLPTNDTGYDIKSVVMLRLKKNYEARAENKNYKFDYKLIKLKNQ